MLAEVVIVPSAPILVPELSGQAAEATGVRDAVIAVAEGLARRCSDWVVVGADDVLRPERGLSAFGVDVPVRLDPTGATPEAALPLSMLIGAWVRGEAQRRSGVPVIAEGLIVPHDAESAECARLGAVLAARVDRTDAPTGVLVVADGATALSQAAPGGGERESAWAIQRRIDAALAAADTAALAALDSVECAVEGVGGRPAWQVLAAAVTGRRFRTTTLYSSAPFGVGYSVARWESV